VVATYFRRGQGLSRNARRAEADGLLPLTRAIRAVAEEAVTTPAIARAVLAWLGASEWHHVGKFASRVDYYDTERAARWAECITPHATRAAVLRRWTRQAWQGREQARIAREISEGHRATNARILQEQNSPEARAASALAAAEAKIIRDAAHAEELARLQEIVAAKPTPERLARIARLRQLLGAG
jgi:hypothetical protein